VKVEVEVSKEKEKQIIKLIFPNFVVFIFK